MFPPKLSLKCSPLCDVLRHETLWDIKRQLGYEDSACLWERICSFRANGLSWELVPYKASVALFLPAFSLSHDSPHDFGDSTENYQL